MIKSVNSCLSDRADTDLPLPTLPTKATFDINKSFIISLN